MSNRPLRVNDMPTHQQPMYRFRTDPGQCSDAEILAIVMGTPTALHGATELLSRCAGLNGIGEAAINDLIAVDQIGESTAYRIKAAFEMASRLLGGPGDDPRPRVTSPTDAAKLMFPKMYRLDQEEFWIIMLDTRNRVLGIRHLYRGTLNTTITRTAEIYTPAVKTPRCAAIIAVHNHPSGDPTPSPEDVRMTREVSRAGELLGITLLDHIIIGHHNFVSLKETGMGFD